jgi:hypothetical protein
MSSDHISSKNQQEFEARYNKIFTTLNSSQRQNLLGSLSETSRKLYLEMEGMNQGQRGEILNSGKFSRSTWEVYVNLPTGVIINLFHEPADIGETVSLNDFINENEKILSILGVFIAVAVFAKDLPIKSLGHMISFLSFGIIILLSLEITFSLPYSEAEIRLKLFGNLFITSIIILSFYWLLDFREIWKSYISGVIIIILIIIDFRFHLQARLHLWIGKRKIFPLRINAIIIKSDTFRSIVKITVSLSYLIITIYLSNWILTFVNAIAKILN